MFEYKFSKLAMQNIDPDGDLEIVLTNTTPTTSVLVSSKCLTLASKVFAAMLSPKFREGAALAKDGKTKIELEDDAKTAIIVLRALHHCNRLVPSYLDADELHVMALIVDKYDLLQAMLPWIKHWVVHHYFAALDSANYHKWLLISWVFEEGTLFTSITKKLIMETKLDKEDELVTKEEKHFCEGVSDLIIGKEYHAETCL